MVDSYEFRAEPHSQQLLTQAAGQLQRIVEAREAVQRDGAFYEDRWGKPREHPGLIAERAAANLFRLLVRELKIEPADDEDVRLPRR